MSNCRISGYPTDSSGHSQVVIDGKKRPHHLYLWEKVYGKVVGDYVLHHLCERGKCINLEHLQIMTRADHSRLHNLGEDNNNSILTEENVKEIRQLWKNDRKNWTYRKLIAKFPGVGKGAINGVVNNKTWKHVEI